MGYSEKKFHVMQRLKGGIHIFGDLSFKFTDNATLDITFATKLQQYVGKKEIENMIRRKVDGKEYHARVSTQDKVKQIEARFESRFGEKIFPTMYLLQRAT